MEKKINIDYIAVVRQKGELLDYSEETINYDHDVINRLTNLVEDSSKTILDMQDYFNHCVKNEVDELNYAITVSYSNSFVRPVKYPNKITEKEYKEELYDLITEYQKKCKDTDTNKRRAERVLKQRFLLHSSRYIYAIAWRDTWRNLCKDTTIKVYSHEIIGFMKKKHLHVTDDIDIFIQTNFCYGSSTYMNFALKYKGVLIVPYSDYVRFYYARMYSLVSYTRDYSPERENWSNMLKMIVELSNLAATNEQLFIKWMIDEVKDMVKGLQDIYQHPKQYIRKIQKSDNKDYNYNYIRINLVSVASHKEYMVKEEEHEISFISEKLSGALNFITNLRNASLLNIDATDAINTILELNRSIYPRIVSLMTQVETDIDRLTIECNIKKELWEKQEEQLNQYIETVKHKGEYLTTFSSIKNHKIMSEVVMNIYLKLYLREDEAYKNYLSEKEKAWIDYCKIDKQLRNRKSFYMELQSYITTIQKYI